MESLKVGLCQLTSIDDSERNFQQIFQLLQSIKSDSGIRLLCFPENSLFMRIKEGSLVEAFEHENKYLKQLADWSKKNKIYIHLGSLPMKESGHVYNASVLIDDTGKLKTSYHKMHLFDIKLQDGLAVKESDTFKHGEKTETFVIDGWKIGQTICYDLRFAELFSVYARQNVDLILVPSAFLVKTGEAHWHILLRARAIESQCYVLASAQSGLHKSQNGQRDTYGHALAVDPWGRVLVDSEASPSLTLVELKKSVIQSVRTQIPMQMHRRNQLNKT